MALVASVDYPNKRIYLSADTVDANLDTVLVYREVVALRISTAGHRQYAPIIEAGGNLEKVAGVSYTLPYARLLLGCRIVPYNTSHKIRLTRDTFTDDGYAGRDCFDRTPLTAGVDVDIDVDIQEVEVRIVSTSASVVTGDPTTVAAAVRTEIAAELAALLRSEKFARNKQVLDPATGLRTVYDNDGTTILGQGDAFMDADGTLPYDGTGPVHHTGRLA